ncbi:MAG: hypothetical protein ABIH83_01775 [Candidatus Micrarchaeota archaeon]
MSYREGKGKELSKSEILENIWSVPSIKLMPGGWLWWFWLFFIHDENTKKTGRCRQIEILWSIKQDSLISVNGMDISVPRQIIPKGNKLGLDGAVAAWYYDGKKVRENFVLEKSMMSLDMEKKSITAPGNTPSMLMQKSDEEWLTKIKTDEVEFELVAKYIDKHPANDPHYDSTKYLAGLLRVDGTRIERFELEGTEKTADGKIKQIKGTAYFQKMYLASPPPQWYWGIYHFSDGSFLTYMQAYVNKNILRDNAGIKTELVSPANLLTSDIAVYHAPSKRVFKTQKMKIMPKRISENLYSHSISAQGDGFEIKGVCSAYAHACWTFVKNISIFPIKSTFKYNEYPAVFERLEIQFQDGSEQIVLENGWGNMENSWGILL